MAIAAKTGHLNDSHGRNDSKSPTDWALRAALVGTTSYVSSSHMPCAGHPSALVVVTCVGVDHTSLQMFVQGSRALTAGDDTDWFDMTVGLMGTAPAVHTTTLANLTSATASAYGVPISIAPGVLFLRVRIKYTGGSAAGTIAVSGYLGSGV